MAKTKTIVQSITGLKVTSEDEWLDEWQLQYGYSVEVSPQYLALDGNVKPLLHWMTYRKLDFHKRLSEILDVYLSVKKEGQKKPILIYADNRINTGHKRAAAMLYLGRKKIKAQIVPDDYKL